MRERIIRKLTEDEQRFARLPVRVQGYLSLEKTLAYPDLNHDTRQRITGDLRFYEKTFTTQEKIFLTNYRQHAI